MKMSETSVAAASNSSDSSAALGRLRGSAYSDDSGSAASSGSGSGSAQVPAPARAPSPRRRRARARSMVGCGFEQAALGGVGDAAGRIAFAQRDERVEHVRAAAAAHVTLSGAQIHGRDDQCQRAFGTDGEQGCLLPARRTAGERRPAVARRKRRDIKPRRVRACHLVGLRARAGPRARSGRRARVSAAKRGASSHSGPHRMLASRMSAPARQRRVRRRPRAPARRRRWRPRCRASR